MIKCFDCCCQSLVLQFKLLVSVDGHIYRHLRRWWRGLVLDLIFQSSLHIEILKLEQSEIVLLHLRRFTYWYISDQWPTSSLKSSCFAVWQRGNIWATNADIEEGSHTELGWHPFLMILGCLLGRIDWLFFRLITSFGFLFFSHRSRYLSLCRVQILALSWLRPLLWHCSWCSCVLMTRRTLYLVVFLNKILVILHLSFFFSLLMIWTFELFVTNFGVLLR